MMLNFNSKKIFFIAEIGVNHNGKLDIAKKLIRQAKLSGANAVKFQLFKSEDVVTKDCKKANYQIKNTKGNNKQLDMLQKLELGHNNYYEIVKYCKKINIKCFTSVFDEKSYEYVANQLKQKIVKIPSGEITNFFLLKKIDIKKTKVLLSTGMSKINEIINAINLISNLKVYKSVKNKIIINNKNLALIRDKILVMQCTTDYPLSDQYVNLNSLDYFKNVLKLNIGFSDHTPDQISSIIAASKNCKIFEKHFTLNKKMKGPDHSASIDPKTLKNLITNLKRIPKILGTYGKKIEKCEIKNINLVRKKIVAKIIIKKGDIFSSKNIALKRPANRISPFEVEKILGKKAKKNYKIDQDLKI